MSPRTSILLALIGVLLAGIPLPALTAARREAPAAGQAEAAPTCSTYATLQCSGQPNELCLRHEGRELARLSAEELSTPWEGELTLPSDKTVALEVVATWPEGSSAQAVTLTLEPEGLPSQQRTEWVYPGSNTLHSLFIFSW